MTLTGSPASGGYEKLFRDFIVLMMRAAHVFGKLEYCAIKTHEGNGVIHLLIWADYLREFASQEKRHLVHCYFSAEWTDIHKSPIVWATKTYGNIKGISRYCVQYVASQKGSTRLSWSKNWVFSGFCEAWRRLCRKYLPDLKKVIEEFDHLIAERAIPFVQKVLLPNG